MNVLNKLIASIHIWVCLPTSKVQPIVHFLVLIITQHGDCAQRQYGQASLTRGCS